MEFYCGHLMSEINVYGVEKDKRYTDTGHSDLNRFAMFRFM